MPVKYFHIAFDYPQEKTLNKGTFAASREAFSFDVGATRHIRVMYVHSSEAVRGEIVILIMPS